MATLLELAWGLIAGSSALGLGLVLGLAPIGRAKALEREKLAEDSIRPREDARAVNTRAARLNFRGQASGLSSCAA